MTRLQIAPGEGLVVRRRAAVLFVPERAAEATALVDAFRGAADGTVLDAVTTAADELALDVAAFVVVEWDATVRLAVFGAVDVTSDHRSLPRLSAGGSATWVERTVRAETIELRSGAASVDVASDVELGTIPAGGFALSVSTSTAERRAAPPPTDIAPTPRQIAPVPAPPPRPAPAVPGPVAEPERVIEPTRTPSDWYDATGGRDDPTLDVPEGFTDGYRPAPAAAGGWTLRFADGPIEPVDATLVFGRRPTADPEDGPEPARLVQVDCPQMSARHLAAWADAAGLWVRDLRSRNGSWVVTSGDQRLVALEPGVATPLDEGAHVQIGTHVFVVAREQADPESPASAAGT